MGWIAPTPSIGDAIMEAEKFDRSVKAFIQRTPFRSFVIELQSGTQVEIDHPGAIVSRAGTAIFVSAGGEPTVFDHEGVARVFGEPEVSAG
jgi:hypothetical protein